jgi:hypothetical protein
LLEADDVGGSKPAIFARPRLGYVFEAVLLRDDKIPKEGFVVFAHFSSSLLPTYYNENRKKKRRDIDKKER